VDINTRTPQAHKNSFRKHEFLLRKKRNGMAKRTCTYSVFSVKRDFGKFL